MNPLHTKLRHLPNVITASRGLAGPVVAWLLLMQGAPRIAFWVFAVAALTDLFDGWLARTVGGGATELGAWLDPLSDKVLVGFSWAGLLAVGWAPWWLAAPMLARNLFVGLAWWFVGDHRGKRIPSSALGQVMASFEGTSIGLLLFHGPWGLVHWPSVGVWVGLISLLLSAASLVGYGRDALAASVDPEVSPG